MDKDKVIGLSTLFLDIIQSMPNRTQFKTHKEYLQWYRDYRKKNPKIREYTRKYNNAWRTIHGYEAEKKSEKKFKDKRIARKRLSYAVSTGKIVRGNCEVCGKMDAQGHHEDYAKPLQVKWLCPKHHAEVHKRT